MGKQENKNDKEGTRFHMRRILRLLLSTSQRQSDMTLARMHAEAFVLAAIRCLH
jgi:hypothetical protein